MSRDFINASSQWASTTTVPVSAVPFSWAVWFKPNSTTANRELLWLGNSGSLTNYWTMGVATSAIRNSARNSTESPANSTAGPTANVWNHACGTFTSNAARAAYLNGGNKGTNATSQTPSSISRFAIASLARSTPTSFFDGQIAHVAVWNVALSDDEVAMLGLYKVSPLMVRPAALVFYAPYLGRDSAEIDIVGAGSLTLNASPAASAEEPPLLWLPGKKKIFLISAAGQSVNVTQTTETDSVFAVTHAKSKAVGLNTESDSALSVTPTRYITVGLNTETNSAFALTAKKAKAVGLNTETDAAFSLSASHNIDVSLTTETDTAFALAILKQKACGLNTETDSAQPTSARKAFTVGLNAETDSAFTIGRTKRLDIAIVEEGDIALPLGAVQLIDVAMATETASAFSVGKLKRVAVHLAEETDLARMVSEWGSGYTIDGENEVALSDPYGAITVYSNGAGGFYSIGGPP